MQLCIDGILVFSTYVEVIPSGSRYYFDWHSILHVCGGDPIRHDKLMEAIVYFPRMWR